MLVGSLALSALSLSAPVAAESWRSCAVGMCLKDSCPNNSDATVLVTGPIDADDPAVGGDPANGMLRLLMQRGTPTGPTMQQCAPAASREEAEATAGRIYTQMSSSFPDTTMASAEQVFPGYGQSSSSSNDSGYGSDNSTQADASADEQGPSDADDNSAAEEEARRAEAQAQALREQQQRQAERDQEIAAQRQREADEAAAAQRERERIAAEKAAQAASTDTDANRCVSSAETRENDTFEGNTSASIINGCGQPVDVRICLMTDTSRGWNCGVVYGVGSQSKGSFSSFHATGQVFVDARLSSSSKPLAQP
jgi:hypothetical protein